MTRQSSEGAFQLLQTLPITKLIDVCVCVCVTVFASISRHVCAFTTKICWAEWLMEVLPKCLSVETTSQIDRFTTE